MRFLVVDGATAMASRLKGWWHDRARAAHRRHHDIAGADDGYDLVAPLTDGQARSGLPVRVAAAGGSSAWPGLRDGPGGDGAAGQAGAVAHVAAHDLGAAAYAIKAVRAAEGDAAGRLECRWQRAQLPDAVRALVLDDQRLRNDLCWSVFDC